MPKPKREQLLKISELKGAERILYMKENEFDEYVRKLNSFIETVPKWESTLKTAVSDNNYAVISKLLEEIRKMLAAICADDIAAQCLGQINTLKNTKQCRLEIFLNYLTSLISILSIDIQVALYLEQNGDGKKPVDDVEESKKSILAVDDKAFFLETLKMTLKDTPYKLTCVTSGKMALNYLQKHSPDLFILDIEMPEMNGYELAEKIRDSGQMAPIIFLTSNSSKEYVQKAMMNHASDFLVKPINQKCALEKIDKLLGEEGKCPEII